MVLDRSRLHLSVSGIVQGVGFRPFVYRLATELGLTGWVNNTAGGVFAEVEGDRPQIEQFCDRLTRDLPPHARIDRLQTRWEIPVGDCRFEIRASDSRETARKTAAVLPDLATCPDCLRELFDPQNRRHRYPFINCTHCGPRYSIVHTLPYDRPRTTMRSFPLCPRCQKEYDNPGDRRFHAQPNACPDCGPHLDFCDRQGTVLASQEDALQHAAAALRRGDILALKGLGGFQLLVRADDEEAVRRLRDRKHRPDKPLAVMYASSEAVRQDCTLGEGELRELRSSAAPIVLLARRPDRHPDSAQTGIAPSVAPNNPYLGVMLPYTPLHHLLLADLGVPVVATSGNLSGEPICIDNAEARDRLGAIADGFLVHNRPIARPVDDSVVRVVENAAIVLRRARGYAPAGFPLAPPPSPVLSVPRRRAVLAVGGYLKNTVAIAVENRVLLSQHVGDLDRPRTRQAFEYTLDKLCGIYDFEPELLACDAHPDYPSSQFAEALAQRRQIPRVRVQHHYAHVLSVVAERQATNGSGRSLEPPLLGVAWDGAGYGLDGTSWGGEFLGVAGTPGFRRLAHWRTFPLPGGDRAMREPRRAALGLLYELWGEAAFERTELPTLQAFSERERQLLRQLLARSLNAPRTSSVGRLFDAVASLLGLCQRLSFEGQGAMALEFAARTAFTTGLYPLHWQGEVLDWGEAIAELVDDRDRGESIPWIAAKFHNTLVEAIVQTVVRVAPMLGALPNNLSVVLSGGCFQNKYLLETAIARLRYEGISLSWNRTVPANDGGLALGQVYAAQRAWQES